MEQGWNKKSGTSGTQIPRGRGINKQKHTNVTEISNYTQHNLY